MRYVLPNTAKFLRLALLPIGGTLTGLDALVIVAGTGIPVGLGWGVGWLAGVAVLVGILALLFLIAGTRLQMREDKQPNLVFRAPEILRDIAPVYDTSWDIGSMDREKLQRAQFAVIGIANDPPIRRGAEARDVHAVLDFYDNDTQEVLVTGVAARWSGTPVPGREEMNLPPNGKLARLDTVIKYPEDEHCFVFNNKSLGHAPDMKKNDHRLSAKHIRVEARVRASNTDELSRRFVIAHGGAGSDLDIHGS